MANWYYDPIDGDNGNSGDSWSVAATGEDGVTNGTTTFTTATGGLSGMAGRYIRILTGLYLIESVVSDTECVLDKPIGGGSGRHWCIGGAVKQYNYLPYSTYFANGDVVKYPKTSGWESAGTITYTSNSDEVVIGSGRVALVDDCESAWTGTTDMTVTLNESGSYLKFGSGSLKMIVASAFTTGKMAYYDFGEGNELDLSAFQGVSMLMKLSGSLAAGSLQLCLCSDATGDVVVDTIDLMQGDTDLYTGVWTQPRGFKSGGGNLGSSIRSIAFYAAVDPGTPTIYIDNIYAILAESNANHICHNCLIGQGNTIDDEMWAILGFTDTTHVKLVGPWYGGTEGAQTSYRVEPAYYWGTYFMLSSPSTTLGFVYGTEIVNSGGWNTSTDTQDGVTCWRGMPQSSSYYRPVYGPSYGYWAVENFIFTRGLYIKKYTNCCRVEKCGFVGTTDQTSTSLGIDYGSYGSYGYQAHVVYRDLWFTAMKGQGIYAVNSGLVDTYADQLIDWVWDNIRVISNYGIYTKDMGRLRGRDIKVNNCSENYQSWYVYQGHLDMDIVGLELKDNKHATYAALNIENSQGRVRIWNLVTSGNTETFKPSNVEIVCYNPDIDDSTIIDAEFGERGKVALMKRDGDAEDHAIWVARGTITSELSIRHTAADFAWKFSPTHTEGLPIRHKLAEIALEAGVAATIGLYLRRDSTDVNARMWIPGGRLAGMSADDYTDDLEAGANVWELLTCAVTPSEDGVIELWVDVWGGTTNSVYVDDLSVTV